MTTRYTLASPRKRNDKTFWVNIIGLFWMIFSPMLGLPTLGPEIEASILMVINVLLRFVTKSPVSWS